MELPAAFSQRIKSTPLTAKEALVAEYILNNFLSVCYVSTSELARILGVSDATVSRTSKVLGYRSFLDLQKEIQSFVSRKRIMHSVASSLPLSVFIPIRAWMPRRIS